MKLSNPGLTTKILATLFVLPILVGAPAEAATRAGYRTIEFPGGNGRDSIKVIQSTGNGPGFKEIHEVVVDCNAGQVLLSKPGWSLSQAIIPEAEVDAIAADYCASR